MKSIRFGNPDVLALISSVAVSRIKSLRGYPIACMDETLDDNFGRESDVACHETGPFVGLA